MMVTLLNKSCLDVLRDMRPVRMVFADPPDNIGLGYKGFKDSVPKQDYASFLQVLIRGAIKKCDVFWLSYNAKHTALVGHLVYRLLQDNQEWEDKPCVQTFTFGQHNKSDLGVAHRPLLRLMKKETALYPDAIRVPSWRQLHGDKRANPKGKVPGDNFDFPRITGNSRQRRHWSPTQLHEGIYERCIKLCCKPGDVVCDLFAGSGTLGRVADRCGVSAIMVEISKATCEAIAKDQGLKHD